MKEIIAYKIKNRTNININDENLNIEKNENFVNNENNEKDENNEVLISKEISRNLKIEEFKLEIEIDPFFENNSITLKFLNDKFLELRKSLNKYIINNAMKEF